MAQIDTLYVQKAIPFGAAHCLYRPYESVPSPHGEIGFLILCTKCSLTMPFTEAIEKHFSPFLVFVLIISLKNFCVILFLIANLMQQSLRLSLISLWFLILVSPIPEKSLCLHETKFHKQISNYKYQRSDLRWACRDSWYLFSKS